LVAAAIAGHPDRAQSLAKLPSASDKTVNGGISGRGLFEIYAVLTRTPFVPPIYPREAWKVISANIPN
jgi:hypothetical protein